MFITDVAIRRPVSVLVFIILFILVGFYSLGKMVIDLFPELNFPIAFVTIDYTGVAPEEMETLITKPLEEVLATVENISQISSISSEGNSTVIMEFDWGTDMDFASLHIREKMDQVQFLLPENAEEPIIQRFNPMAIPVIELSAYGADLRQVKQVAEDQIKPMLERIDEVATADLAGGDEREILVAIDRDRLNAYGLSLNNIVNALHQENLNWPAGKFTSGDKDYLVRTVGEFKNIPQIEDTVISLQGKTPIRIHDLASVLDTVAEREEIARLNLEPSVSIAVKKQSEGNIVKIADTVKKRMEILEKILPSNVGLSVATDTSTYIKTSINMVKENAYLGAALAAVILLLFLRNLRSTAIILIAIPTSIISTFTFMFFKGMTINMISLGGLALGVGMVIDNSIVVLENIYRHLRERKENDRYQLAARATNEVTLAVLTATFTTLAVFLPIGYIKGVAGEIFRDLAWSVTLSLSSSIIVAFTVVPMLASRWLKITAEAHETEKGKIKDTYLRIITFFNSRFPTRILLVALIVITFMLVMRFMQPVQAFFPEMDQGLIMAKVELPIGTSLEYTDSVAQKVEKIILGEAQVEKVATTVTPHIAQMNITLKEKAEKNLSGLIRRKISPEEKGKWRTESHKTIMKKLRRKVAASSIPDTEISFSEPRHGPGGERQYPVEIQVIGDDHQVLEQLTAQLALHINVIEELDDITTSLEEGKPEAQIKIDRQKASDLGISLQAIAQIVETSIGGTVAGKFREAGDEYDIRVKLAEDYRTNISQLETLLVAATNGTQYPLREVAAIQLTHGPVQIERIDQRRVTYVWANCDADKLGLVSDKIRTRLQTFNLPNGYYTRFGGQEKERMEAFAELFKALIFSIFLVFLIMAALFESFTQPFIIMVSVPLAIMGVFAALFLGNIALSIPSYIGLIMLAGIVVNNAILLIDYTNTLRKEGLPAKEAAIRSGSVRLRPVLMTSLTTILGMVPLASGLGAGSEFFQPLALAVIGGLAFSTFFTLIFIPIAYVLIDNLLVGIRLLHPASSGNERS